MATVSRWSPARAREGRPTAWRWRNRWPGCAVRRDRRSAPCLDPSSIPAAPPAAGRPAGNPCYLHRSSISGDNPGRLGAAFRFSRNRPDWRALASGYASLRIDRNDDDRSASPGRPVLARVSGAWCASAHRWLLCRSTTDSSRSRRLTFRRRSHNAHGSSCRLMGR